MRKNYRKKKFNKKRKSTYKIFFLILVGMTVGFAALNTTLQLIGTLNIARTTWNIHWENPTKIGGVTATQDVHLKTGDNTTVEYQVNLSNPGDYYEFTVDAKNDGTIDAMVTGISNKIYENNVEVNPTYLESTITYSDGDAIDYNHLLAASKKETYKVKVQYKTGLAADELPDSTKTYSYRFTVTYMQADEATAKNRLITLPTGKTKDDLEVGDEICLKGECFNFLKYEGTNNEDIVMLAKYNLNVGPNAKGTATNKQDSDVRANCSGPWYGSVRYSQIAYWGSETTYPLDMYDSTNYAGAPGTNNYSVAYYVEAYKDILTDYGITIKDARLLKVAEATDSSIGCNVNTCPTTGTTAFITNTSFWLGTTNSNYSVFSIRSDGGVFMDSFEDETNDGVRPVIVISKSNI